MRVLSSLSIGAALLLSISARAQEQTSGVQGVVRDASGAVLNGARVEARSPNVVGVSTTARDEEEASLFDEVSCRSQAASRTSGADSEATR